MLDLDALGRAEGESWVYKGADVLDDGSPGCADRVLLSLSRGGADAVVVREFDLGLKAFVPEASGGFVLPEAKTRASWKNKDTRVYIAGKDNRGHGGWAHGNIAAGDVCVFKLEAHQLSLRVQRLGGQTFTLPTNGAPGLRVLVSMYKKTRVQLSRAEPGEEY